MEFINILRNRPRKREMVAWVLVILQFFALTCVISSSSKCAIEDLATMNQQTLVNGYDEEISVSMKSKDLNSEKYNLVDNIKMNDHDQSYYESRRNISLANNSSSFYEDPVIHPKDAGLVSRIWRSNGSPSINGGLHQGSCWCSYDEWCVCTPALAIDLIMTSGPDHLWVVQRQDTGLVGMYCIV